MDFGFVKPDGSLIPCQACLCGWEKLNGICSAILSGFLGRPVSAYAIGENSGDGWELKLADAPLPKDELAALLDALGADDYDWDANCCGNSPVWGLSQGVAWKLAALALPFPANASHASDEGVWFTGETSGKG